MGGGGWGGSRAHTGEDCAYLMALAGNLQALVHELQGERVVQGQNGLHHAANVLGQLLAVKVLKLIDLVDDEPHGGIHEW